MRIAPLLILISLCSGALGDAPATQPALPVRVVAETRDEPAMKLWVVQIDLTDPRVAVRIVPGGPDPDGDGPWQTTLMPVSRIAQREQFDLAVNASFFSVDKTGEYAGKGYTEDQPAAVNGRTVTDGRVWSRSHDNWPVLWIDSSGRAHISSVAAADESVQQMVAGNAWIIRCGDDAVPTEGMMTKRHPRTAVGVDREGKTLTILSVDGRQAGVSIGMTGAELRDELAKYGVYNAINLDGGGSTTLVQRDPATGELKVINRPSDGKERPVANVLGASIRTVPPRAPARQ